MFSRGVRPIEVCYQELKIESFHLKINTFVILEVYYRIFGGEAPRMFQKFSRSILQVVLEDKVSQENFRCLRHLSIDFVSEYRLD